MTNFLKQVLVVESEKRLGWKALSTHALFLTDSGKLSNEFIINFKIVHPENVDDEEKFNSDNEIGEGKEQGNNFLSVKGEGEFIRLTAEQTMKKKEDLNEDEDRIYQWALKTHLECLKTELIFTEIISPVQQHKLLDFDAREVI